MHTIVRCATVTQNVNMSLTVWIVKVIFNRSLYYMDSSNAASMVALHIGHVELFINHLDRH